MPEITLGTGESGGSTGGSSGFDIESFFEQLETAQKKIAENPQLAEMMGVSDDIPMANTPPAEGGDSGAQLPNGEPVTLDNEFLENLLRGLCETGYENHTIGQLHTFVQENPEMVDNLIQEHA